ncbi:MAG: ROK family protein [Candidatus Hydrogenedentes bacterium]|nr:ROK family protein [Candidatus Hydrogenedentota bacterium]
MALWGGVEAGGTKFVCAVAAGPEEILAETRFPTTTPQETIARAVAFFLEEQQRHGPVAGLGIASFGPVDPKPGSPTYGCITTTPKRGWANTDLAGPLREALRAPIGFDTDVNGAALAEGRWGAAQGLDTFVYLTVGTGIGGGAMVNGKLVHGLLHPEMGHVFVPHDRGRDPFPGACPYHGDCLEGLASGPALEARWGCSAEALSPDHAAWDLEAEYLASGLVPQLCIISPQRIVLGGGVMEQAHLFPRIRARFLSLLNGYIQRPEILRDIGLYIVPPGLGNRAGVLGAIALAQDAAAP